MRYLLHALLHNASAGLQAFRDLQLSHELRPDNSRAALVAVDVEDDCETEIQNVSTPDHD